MIVLDASVVVELFINGRTTNSIRSKLAGGGESILVPHLLDIEVLSAIRRLTAGKRMDPHRNAQFLMDLAALPAQRYSHTSFISRIGEVAAQLHGL